MKKKWIVNSKGQYEYRAIKKLDLNRLLKNTSSNISIRDLLAFADALDVNIDLDFVQK